MGYGGTTDPRLLAAIRSEAPPDLQPILLADAWVEGGGRLDAVGDNGHSHGPWQEYDQGRGAGLSVAQRRDPVGATRRAAKEFAAFKARGFSGGELAYRAQRPADHNGYVAKVNSYLEDAKRVLGQPGGSTAQGPLPNLSGQETSAPTATGADFKQGVAMGLAGGQDLFHSVVAAALSAQGTPATSQRQGVAKNPRGAQGLAEGASGPVDAAKRYLGTPYSWGGGTPSGPTRGIQQGANTVGYDCSSLVQMAWAKMGVNLPRTTYDQIKVGQGINAKNPAAWRPGDLMFPSTGHVQMYVGNGKVIEAPRTGGHVQIVPMRSSYIAVRRPG